MRLMYRLTFNKSDFIPPSDPNLRIEMAIDCDGAKCGLAIPDENGSLDDLPPHYHLVESQIGAWTRSYPFGGMLPRDHYKSSH